MYNTIIYILSVLMSIFIVSGINFNNFFKKNHIWEARMFIVVISFIMGYLFGSFIIEFFDYCVDIFSSLPSNLGAILISVVTISFVVIIYKAIHS